MLGKRRTGDMYMISDAGGNNFIKNADIIKLLNDAGAKLNPEKEEERYNIVNDIYKKDAARWEIYNMIYSDLIWHSLLSLIALYNM